MRKTVFLLLFACCVFAAKADKIIIERPDNPDIDSISIEKDTLTIKARGKTYSFSIADLVQSKIESIKPPPNTSRGSLEEAFETAGKWYFYKVPKSGRNVFRYLDKNAYEAFQEGELLQKVLYKNRYYARDVKNNIYVPHWEVKPDFSLRLIPAEQYIKALNSKIQQLKKNVNILENKVSLAQNTVKIDREKYIQLLRENNFTQTKTDENGNVIQEINSTSSHSTKLNRQLKLYEKNIKTEENKLNALEQTYGNQKRQLDSLRKLQQETDKLYKQYVK